MDSCFNLPHLPGGMAGRGGRADDRSFQRQGAASAGLPLRTIIALRWRLKRALLRVTNRCDGVHHANRSTISRA
jgi:hypothetical protein